MTSHVNTTHLDVELMELFLAVLKNWWAHCVCIKCVWMIFPSSRVRYKNISSQSKENYTKDRNKMKFIIQGKILIQRETPLQHLEHISTWHIDRAKRNRILPM